MFTYYSHCKHCYEDICVNPKQGHGGTCIQDDCVEGKMPFIGEPYPEDVLLEKLRKEGKFK
jgi:hypothetical protein